MAHTVEEKAEAVARMLTGESLHSVERKTGIDRKTLVRWYKRHALRLLPAADLPGWDFSGFLQPYQNRR